MIVLLLMISFVIAAASLIACIFTYRQYASSRVELLKTKDMLAAVNPEKSLEENLDRMLEAVSNLVTAPTYTFYVIDKKQQNYLLKAVRYQSKGFGEVRPSYSGLVSFQENAYLPPISLPVSRRVYDIRRKHEGEIPVYYMPVGDRGLVLLGPVEHIPKRSIRLLDRLSPQMETLLHYSIVTEEVRSQAEVVVASGKALQKITNISLDSNMLIELVIKLCMQSLHAAGGFMARRTDGRIRIHANIGLDQDTQAAMEQDEELLLMFRSLSKQRDISYVRSSEEAYYQLPPFIAAAGMETLMIVSLDDAADSYILLWFESEQQDEDKQSDMVKMLMDYVNTAIGYQGNMRHFSDYYFEILKLLARLMDNMNPYTVGYSEMMSRYSVAIAQQMGLPEEEIRDIALAAYLSNIGVLGLSGSLLEKEGKYSETEYELMKLHSEVGASIVNVATGNERIANYILYHHERMDGNGYPHGLKEHEIPTGSRIIAVVQTFLAKIFGRNYRDPLPFNDALHMLRSAAGAQLDEQIVDVFCDWYEKKRKVPEIQGKPMGKCWEVLCVPSSICERCPVFQADDQVPCWEIEQNLCKAHGKKCETCIVRTEYIGRHLDAHTG